MRVKTNNGYQETEWNGITIRATSDGRIELEIPGNRLYMQPDENGVFLRDHNSPDECNLDYDPA
jgi:hypothetical protein